MSKNYTEDEIGDIIGYWVEAMHIHEMLSVLVEYTDEVGELYETDQWMSLEVPDNKNSFLGLLKDLEGVDDRAYSIEHDASKKLMEMIEWALENRVGVWG